LPSFDVHVSCINRHPHDGDDSRQNTHLDCAEKKVDDAGDADMENPKAPPALVTACCVCMEPWSSEGAHRMWYVPTILIQTTTVRFMHGMLALDDPSMQLHRLLRACVRQIVLGDDTTPLRR
jgi:hypothetical protein